MFCEFVVSAILDFLEGHGVDGAGRRISEVLAFGLGALESHHDYIQWLFPLTEPSGAVPGSPVLDAQDVAAIKASPKAQANLAAAQRRMDWFYEWTDHWLQAGDHNHLRITRIIKSVRLLVGDGQADQFRSRLLSKVQRLKVKIPEPTLRYWRAA
jgi:hypothetical protein